MIVTCEPLYPGDDHAGQGHCGKAYDITFQWTICPHRDHSVPADPDPPMRFHRNGYAYLDSSFREIFRTSVPRNTDEALDYFTKVAGWFYGENRPKYIAIREHDQAKLRILPFEYDSVTDTWSELDRQAED